MSRMYAQAGGMAGGQNTAAVHDARVIRDVNSMRKKGWTVQRVSSFKGAMQAMELAETGTRVGVFALSYKKGLKLGLTEREALIEAAFTARDYMDFGRYGSSMLAAKRVIPFMNAAMQGVDKGLRVAIKPIVKMATGKRLTARDKRELGEAGKAWIKMSVIGTLGLTLEAIYRDNKVFEDASPYLRATHWIIPVEGSKIIAIPKPFELALVSNAMEQAYRAYAKNDPMAWQRFREGAFETLMPPTSITMVKPIVEHITNYSFFHERPILPQNLKGVDAALQWNNYTSELGKFIGKKIGIAPVFIDNYITGWSGSWGRHAMNQSNKLRPNAPEEGWEDAFILSRFLKDGLRGANSSRSFWDAMSFEAGEFATTAGGYSDRMESPGAKGDPGEFLAGKPDEVVAFAILNAAPFTASDKRVHPLRRAADATVILSAVRREIVDANLIKAEYPDEKIVLSPPVAGTVNTIMTQLTAVEYRNGLIGAGVKGWKQKQIWDSRPIWEELREASPEVYDEVRDRYEKGHIYSEAGVRRVWPEAKQRLLEDREEAYVDDLAADAEFEDDPGDLY